MGKKCCRICGDKDELVRVDDVILCKECFEI